MRSRLQQVRRAPRLIAATRRAGLFALTLSLSVALSSLAPALVDVPPLRGRVNDIAGLLSAEQRRELEEQLAAFERQTSHQVVVLTVPTLDGEDVAAFSIRVAEQWQIGHEGLDNGVIIVVADRDRKARIEVGYGLEGVIPDAVAARILREQMIPSFREGRMGEGIVRGAQMVMRAARGEEIPVERRPSRAGSASDPMGVVMFGAILGGMIGALVSRRSRVAGAATGGVLAFALTYLILHALGFAIFSSLIASAFAGLGGGPGGGRMIRTFPGGWRTGGGGFGGGGFSGGGGGFGGGGASGSW